MVRTPSLAPTFGGEARLPLMNARASADTTARGARRSAIYDVWGSLTFGGVKVCRRCFFFLWCGRLGVVTVVVPPGVVTVVVAPGVVTVVVAPGTVTVVLPLGTVVVPPLVAGRQPLLQTACPSAFQFSESVSPLFWKGGMMSPLFPSLAVFGKSACSVCWLYCPC
jgi:hypothetical protein